MDLELDYKKTMSPKDKSNCFPETIKSFFIFFNQSRSNSAMATTLPPAAISVASTRT